MLKVAELVIAAALQRRESRGSHSRLDYPVLNEMLTGRHYVFQPVFEGISKGDMLQASQGDSKYYRGNGGPGTYMMEEREEIIFNG